MIVVPGGEGGRHDQVLGAHVRRRVQVQVGAAELPGLDVDLVPGLVHGGAQPGEPPVVEVEVAAAQVAAADALDDRLSQPVQEGGHEDDRAAEAAGDLGREHRAGQGGGIHHERAFRLMELDHRADRLRQLHRPAHVLDRRHVPQHRPALGRQERGGDHLERGILGTLHEYGALQRYAALDSVAGLGANGHGRAAPVPWVPARRAHGRTIRQAVRVWTAHRLSREREACCTRALVFHRVRGPQVIAGISGVAAGPPSRSHRATRSWTRSYPVHWPWCQPGGPLGPAIAGNTLICLDIQGSCALNDPAGQLGWRRTVPVLRARTAPVTVPAGLR